MKDSKFVEIAHTEEYGATFLCEDAETYDLLEDFLAENCNKIFSVKFEGEVSQIYFEPHESMESLQRILRDFMLVQGR